MRHRDAVSSLYTYGYGLFRRYFLEIGERLTGRSVLEQPDDIMYLTIDEVVALLTEGDRIPAASLAASRKEEIEEEVEKTFPDYGALKIAVGAIEKQFGKGAIMALGERSAERVPAIAPGCPSLELALHAGDRERAAQPLDVQ